jgi:outer membrane protein TolC
MFFAARPRIGIRACMRRTTSLAVLGVFSLATGSVRAAPPTPATPTAPPPAAASPDADQFVTNAFKIDDPMLTPVSPPDHLLGSFGDALRLVRDRSTALRISEAQVVEAVGAKRQALATALPTLTSSGSLTRYLLLGHTDGITGASFGATGAQAGLVLEPAGSLPDPATLVNASATLTQPIFNLGNWYGIGTANRKRESAEFTMHDTERQLLAKVALAAVNVITSSRVAESSRNSLASALSTLDLTRRRAELGAASAVDVLRSDQEVSTSRAQIVSADESLRQAREALGAALGDTTQWGVSPELHVEDLERTATSVCKPVNGVESRSDIRAAAKTVEAAERDRNSVDYSYVPTVNLTSNVSYVNSTFFSANGEHVNWTVGAVAAWTLYDGGDRDGRRLLTQGAATVAREQLTQAKRDAILQVVQADRAVNVARTNLEVSTRARDIAKESARLSRLAFMGGSGTSFDLVDSASRLRNAEIDLLIKNFSVYQAMITAYLARSDCSY